MCAQACLVPQSVEPIKTVPHPPPRFDIASFPRYLVEVPILQLFRQTAKDAVPPTCHCEIVIPPLPIIEDDPTVDLLAHWFIDYDLSNTISLAPWPGHDQLLQGTFDDPNATRRTINSFSFGADSVGINVNGTHTLEVVVGERDGFDNSPNAQFPNRSMKQGYTLAVYRFVINVHIDQTSTAPCPSEPPSVRTCP